MSSDFPDLSNQTPGQTEPAINAVRGWQSLAEKRGQELEQARAELAAYRASEKARQLASEYPDAAEIALRDRGELIPSMESELAAMQRGIEAARASEHVFIDSNHPRRPTAPPPATTTADLEREAGDQLASYLAKRF